MWFFLTLYLQGVLHDGALAAGLSFLPMTGAVFAGSTLAPRLVARFGARPVITAGMLSATIGMLLLSGVHPGGAYAAQVLPGGVLSAFGLGLALVPSTIVAMQGVPRAQSGLASGLINTSRLVGGALGLAILGTLAATHTKHELAASLASPMQALTDGYQLAFLVGAAFCLAGALAAVTLVARVRAPEPTGAEGPEVAPVGGRSLAGDRGRDGEASEVLAA
jgi:MFS family permease